MAKRKTQDQPQSGLQADKEVIRLQFRGAPLELMPTVENSVQVLQTEEYEVWINGIKDTVTKARITNNVNKMRRGLFGDWKEVGDGVFELRMDLGPGYRVYYVRHGNFVVILLGGGDKSGQRKDIADAQRLWGGLKHEITQV